LADSNPHRGLLIVAVVQAGLFLWQLVLLRKTVADSARAVHAAEGMLAATKEATTRQLRAYLFVDQAGIEFPEPGVPHSKVVVRNGGLTPALEVRHWMHQWCARYPLDGELPVPPDDMPLSIAVMGPGNTSNMAVAHPPGQMIVKPEYLAQLGTDVATVYVYGELQYLDVFGFERRTKYRLMYGGAKPGAGNHLKPYPGGNEAT
jgi:hypothetical protein